MKMMEGTEGMENTKGLQQNLEASETEISED